MGKAKSKRNASRKNASKQLTPKKKCCEDRPRCARCPIRMLKEGTLPDGYGVHRRRLVRV